MGNKNGKKKEGSMMEGLKCFQTDNKQKKKKPERNDIKSKNFEKEEIDDVLVWENPKRFGEKETNKEIRMTFGD